jgi:hypothetical protein
MRLCCLYRNTDLENTGMGNGKWEMGNDQLIAGLRRLCGHVENGSDVSVTIFQDDATREWVLKISQGKRYYAESFTGVIEEAIAGDRKKS